jgi:hypothetical protein
VIIANGGQEAITIFESHGDKIEMIILYIAS